MSEHGGAHHAGALLHSPSQIRLRKRIESLEFVDDLHDDIASFLTKAHCEADVLKYLDGQLIYSRPANLDRDRWLKVKDSIYGPGANPNAAGAGGQAGAALTAEVAGEEGGGGAPEGCAEGARTNGNPAASDQLPVNQPTQNQDPRFFWDSTSAGDFKGCKRVFGGPPFSSEIRWPKVVHEKTWETFLEISEVEQKVAEGAGGGAGESTEGGGKGGAGGSSSSSSGENKEDRGSSSGADELTSSTEQEPASKHGKTMLRGSPSTSKKVGASPYTPSPRKVGTTPVGPLNSKSSMPRSGSKRTARQDDSEEVEDQFSGEAEESTSSPSCEEVNGGGGDEDQVGQISGSRRLKNNRVSRSRNSRSRGEVPLVLNSDDDDEDDDLDSRSDEPRSCDDDDLSAGGARLYKDDGEFTTSNSEVEHMADGAGGAGPRTDGNGGSSKTSNAGGVVFKEGQHQSADSLASSLIGGGDHAGGAGAASGSSGNLLSASRRYIGTCARASASDVAAGKQDTTTILPTSLRDPADLLQFSSCFESGNLKYACFRGVMKRSEDDEGGGFAAAFGGTAGATSASASSESTSYFRPSAASAGAAGATGTGSSGSSAAPVPDPSLQQPSSSAAASGYPDPFQKPTPSNPSCNPYQDPPINGYNTYVPVYDLILDHDTNSLGHVQWFYFAVRGFKRAQTIRFRIINSCKGASLFQMGMRPLVWSELHTSKVLARLRSGGSSKGSASGATSAEGVGMSFSTPPGAASSVTSASSGATASVEQDNVGGPTGDNFDGSGAPAPAVSITSTRHGGVATEVATNLLDPLSSSELLPKLWRPTGENVTYSRNRIPRAQRAQHRPVGVAMGRTASTGNLLGVHAQMNGGENNGDGGHGGASAVANGEQFGGAGGFSGTITSGFGAGGNSATNIGFGAGGNSGRGGGGAVENNNSYFTLTFDITFEYDNDTCYIAYTYPYTYSSLRSLLRTIQTEYPEKAKLLRRRQLCQTLGRAEVDLLSVSNWNIPREDKRYVVVSSRVHPGEANASWLMHGFLNFILSNSPEAQVLRSHFIFKIVPMLNPDGVVSGNYRCSLAGVDLNRQWRFPDPVLDQSVYELKRILFKLKKQLVLYLDLHGHSRQTSLFAYGCSTYAPTDHRFYTVRMYPKILSVLAPEFSYPHCCFGGGGQSKRGTGRVVVARDIGLVEAFTIEASFFGALVDRDAGAAAKDLAANCSNSNSKEGPLEEKKNSKDSTTESSEGGGDHQAGSNGNEGANKNGDSDDDGDDDVVPAAPGHQAGSNCNKLLQSKSFKQVVPFTPHKLSLLGATLARGLLIHFHLAKEVQQYQLSKSTFRTYLGKGANNAPPKKKQNGTKSGTPSDDVTEAEAAEGKTENEKVHSPSKKSPKKRSSSSSPKKKVASIVAEQQGRSPKKKKDSSPSKKKKKSPKKKKAKKAAVDEDDVDGEENDAGDNENDELRSDAEGDEEGPTSCGTKKKYTLVSDADEEPDGEEEEGQTSSASEGEVLVAAADIKERKEADKEPDAAVEEENDEENEKDKESEEHVEDEEADPTLEEDDRMNSPVKTSASSLSPIKPGATAAVSTMSMTASPMKTQLPGSTSPSKGSSGSAALSGGLASFASFLANGTKSNSWVGKNVVPIHGLEFEAAPDDVRLFDFLSAESEQVWMAAQRGESVAATKSWMNENKKQLVAARAAALDIAGSSPTKQLAAAAPAPSSSTTASGGESDGQKVCSSASSAEGQADTSSAVPTRLKHWENEMQSGLQAQGVRFSPDPVEESGDAGAKSSLADLSVNGTKALEQNKNSMSGINVEALMREILIESQEKTKKKKDPEPSDELEEGSDSNPSGDNLSPEKLRKMRERMGSRDGTNGGGKRNRIRVGGEGRGDGVRARGGGNQGHFHGLMRHYLQVRNLFNAKEDLAIRQQKMSLLNRIVAFGRTTYISKNSQNAQSMPDLALAGTGAAAGPGDTTTRGDDGTDMANALAVAEKAMQQQAGGATAGAAPAGSIAGSGACGASGPVRVSGSSSKPQPAAPLPNSDSRSSAASSATAAFASGNAAAATCEAASDSVQSVGGIPLQGSNWQSLAGGSQSSSSSATTLQPVVPAPTLSNQTLSLFPSAAPSASVLGTAGAGSTNTTVAPAAGAGAPSAADIAGAGVEIANSMINGTGLGSAPGGAAAPGMANGGTGTGANSGATATGFRTRSTPNLNRTGRKKTKKKKWVSPVIESALKFLQTTTSGGPPVVGASNGAGNSTTVVVAAKSSGPGSVSVADGTTTGLSRGVSATATGSAAAPGAESATGAGGAAPAVANPNSFGNTVVGQPLLPGLALSSVVQPGAPSSSDAGADPSRNPNLVLVLEETHKSDQEQPGGSQEKLPRRRPMPMTILTPTHARSSASSSAGGSANASPVKGDADRDLLMREQEDESKRLLTQVTQSIDTKIYEEITPLIPHTNYHHAVDKATASMLSNRQLQNPANNVDPPGGATSQPPQVSAHPQPHPAQLHQQGTTTNPNPTSSSTVLKLELEHAHPLKTRTSRSFLLKGGGHGGGHLHTGATGGAAASGPGAGAPQSLRDHLLAAASQSQAQAQDHHHDSGHVGNGMRQPSHSPDATSAALHPAGEREGHLQGQHAGAIMFNRTVGATASHHLHQLPPVQGTSGPPPHSGGYHHTQHGSSSSYRGSHLQQSGPSSTKTGGLLSSSSSVPPLPSRSLAALVRSVDSGAAKAAAMHSSANIMDVAGGGPPSSSSTYNLAQHVLQHQQQHAPHQLHVSTQQHPLPAANGSWTTTNTGVNSAAGVTSSSGPGSHHQYAHGHGHAQLQHHHLHRGGGHQSGEHPASSTSMKMIFAGASQHVGSSQPHHPATHSVMGAIRRALSQQNQNEQDAHFGSSGGASSSGSNVVIVDEQHLYTGGLGGHPQHHGTSSGAGGAGPGAANGASTTNPNRSGRLFQRHTIQNGARMIVQLDNKPWYGGAGGAQSGGPAARTTTRQL